jgi:Histidine-specific methyltransferase, SAM-dependent
VAGRCPGGRQHGRSAAPLLQPRFSQHTLPTALTCVDESSRAPRELWSELREGSEVSAAPRVLLVVNRELDADFAVEELEHVAVWDAADEWIEMRLRAEREQRVTIGDLGLTVTFAAGEELRTEISAKFRRENIEAKLAGVVQFWTDPVGDFRLILAES